jgi:hypothetical protein
MDLRLPENISIVNLRNEYSQAGVKTPLLLILYGTSEFVPCYEASSLA